MTINTSEYDFDLYSLYNPPSKLLPIEFFLNLESKKKKCILAGDLNSKTEVIGCRGNNRNGSILEKILVDSSMVIQNNMLTTFNRLNSDYFELLDLILSSGDISNKMTNLEVLYDHDMDSDHFSVLFDFNKADWDLFRFHLEEIVKAIPTNYVESLSIDELNEFITDNINEAASISIPKY